ncbi:uncharacterized protein LOC126901330 [Daktulosphaira vitifoliae]|uniref:uncharacterized protein LOC126901330 n=1 Tax=Daktulosphaira vitifoliae TaxID=58002 RepID=UPI0021AA2FFC|nr:uncharacterized protein LOC126901330 [Daktulosphaira vitifoliae]
MNNILSKIIKNKRELIEKKFVKFSPLNVTLLTFDEARVQLELLEQAFKLYNEAHECVTIQNEIDDNTRSSYINELENLSEKYMTVKANLTSHIRYLNFNSQNQEVALINDLSQQTIMLPLYDTPAGNSDTDNRTSFRGQLENILKNKNLNDTIKMYYLRRNLSGSSFKVLDSQLTIGQNYLEALESLNQKYDDKKIATQMHVKTLLMQPCVPVESVSGLKSLMDCTDNQLKTLSKLGRPVQFWDDLIVNIISSKLPIKLKESWEIEVASYAEMPSWNSLKQFLEQKIQILDNHCHLKTSCMLHGKVPGVHLNTPSLQKDNRSSSKISTNNDLSLNEYSTTTQSEPVKITPHSQLHQSFVISSLSPDYKSLDTKIPAIKITEPETDNDKHLDIKQQKSPSSSSANSKHAVSTQDSKQTRQIQLKILENNAKFKCHKFLVNLLDLSSKEPKPIGSTVQRLVQDLVDAKIESEQFCDKLYKLLNASPQPSLIDFLEKSLPILRKSLIYQEMMIRGIQPPQHEVAIKHKEIMADQQKP